MGIMKLLFGDYSKRELKRVQPICDQVLALEETYRAMGEPTSCGTACSRAKA